MKNGQKTFKRCVAIYEKLLILISNHVNKHSETTTYSCTLLIKVKNLPVWV